MKRQKDDEDRIKELRRDAAELAEESIEGMDDPIVKEMLSEADEMDESIDRWRIVEFPALAKADEYFDNETHDIIHYPSGYTPDDLSLRPLRKAGEALHPARYSRNYYLKIKRNNPREFAAMFQLTPQIDETAYFNIHQIKRYKPADRPKLDSMDVVTAWDLAIGTKQYNDHTVGLALARDHKRRVWLLDRIRGRWDDIRIVSDLIIDLHVKWNSTITGIEKMMVEQTMGPILRAKMEERQDYINLAEGQEALKPITDKAVRARTFQNWVNGGLVYVPEGEDWDDYISILSRFLVSNIDDDTDASAWGAILLNRTSPPEDPKEANRRQRDMDEEYDDDELLGSTSRSYMEA
jgi:predicted phage terminase large subunit-like protein